MSYDEILQQIMAKPTWPERFTSAQWFDGYAKRATDFLLSNTTISACEEWDYDYPGWENGVMDNGMIMRFIRGGVVKKIYDDAYPYPQNSRYTFWVAVYTFIGMPEQLPNWDKRVLNYRECQKLGFNPITGTSDIYPFINVGTSAEYLEISNGYKNVMEKRYQSISELLKRYDTSNKYWKYVKQAYLDSKEWSTFRWRARVYYNFSCKHCGPTNRIIDVDHIHYNTIGRESLEDVQLLCRPCHRRKHGITEVTQ